MEYATIKNAGPVHVAHVTPLSRDVIRLKASVAVQDYKTVWSDTAIDFYADLLTTGTTTRTKEGIETYLKKHGIMLAVTGGKNKVHFSMTVERTAFRKGLALLEEIIASPAFPLSEFKLRKQTLLEENREARDNAKLLAEIHFINTLYPKTSYFHATTFDEQLAHLGHIAQKDFKKLHTAMLAGEWFITLVAPEAEYTHLVPLIKKLSHTARIIPALDSVTNPVPTSSTYMTVPGKTNVEVRIGNILPITAADDDFVPFVFGLDVLGKTSGFAGRLMSTVREKEGLTYGIYARAQNVTRAHAGYWNIFTFFAGKDLEKGITSTTRELKHLIADGITAHELKIFKEITRNQFLITHGSDSGRLSLYHAMLLSHETPGNLRAYVEKIESLTEQRVHDALVKYIDPRNLVISGAGPVTKNGKGM